MQTVVEAPALYRMAQKLALFAPSKLDLGSGPEPAAGFTGLDVCSGPSVVTHDFVTGEPWPFGDESIDELRSSHFIEHVMAVELDTYEFAITHYLGEGKYQVRRSSQPTAILQSRGRRDALVWVMEEAWRVAKPGAIFHLSWPAMRDEKTKEVLPWAFADPTHRRFLPAEWLHYLSLESRRKIGVEQYGWRCNWTGAENAYGRDLGMTHEIGVRLVKEPLP